MFRVRQTLSHLACSSAWAVGMAPCAYAAGLRAQAAGSGDAQNGNHAGGRSRLRCAWIDPSKAAMVASVLMVAEKPSICNAIVRMISYYCLYVSLSVRHARYGHPHIVYYVTGHST